MELDFNKYCVVDRSPTTVLPASQCHSKVTNRKSNGKPGCGNYTLSLDSDFTGISFNRYRSASCRDAQSRRSNRKVNEMPKRGSVYQSSKEVRQLKKTDGVERKKIEFSRGSESTLSFGIIDSLCSSDEDSSLVERDRSSVMSSEQSTSSFCKNQTGLRPRDSISHSFHPIPGRIQQNISSSDKTEKQFMRQQSVQDLIFASESSVAPINGGNSSEERDPAVNLLKSLSVKLALPRSPAQSESDGSKSSSSGARCNHARKVFNPCVKSKSYPSPLTGVNETGLETMSGHAGTSCDETICKPPLIGSSDKPNRMGYNSQWEKKENYNSVALCSPAHLHGLLKLENKHGVPFFEFSVKSPEDVLVAKAWKADDALTRVYTFHSLHQRRKSSAIRWGYKDNNRESAVVGQMLVSCYLYKESKGDRGFEDSMVTECVLYDVAHSRIISSKGNSSCSPEVNKVPLVSDEQLSWDNYEQIELSSKKKNKGQFKHSCENSHFQASASQPLPPAELHPELQVAAIIMQVPLEKGESRKLKSRDRKLDPSFPKLLDLCQLKHAGEGISDTTGPGKMHVVIPAGKHSLPSTESCGPSSLLDRWRLSGGCDCGGWDVACPLYVFGNPNFRIAEGLPVLDNQLPAQLFVQGRKDDPPAFSMMATEDGKYAVDFHAQLSSLQAFSICVAILHAAEASTAVGQERSKKCWQSDSLRVFPEEEIKRLIDVIAEEEKFEAKKKMEEVLASFVVNPPFSPIARV